jgi:ketosteroid isomerase-like protein
MSEGSIDLVRRAMKLWEAREFDRLAGLADRDFELDLSRNLDAAVYPGLEGLRRWTDQIGEVWDDFRFQTDDLTAVGEHVVTRVQMSGKGRESGAETTMTVFQLWRFRNGKIARVVGGYRDRAEAIADAEDGD